MSIKSILSEINNHVDNVNSFQMTLCISTDINNYDKTKLIDIIKIHNMFIIEFKNGNLYIENFDEIIKKLNRAYCNYVIIYGKICRLLSDKWILRPDAYHKLKAYRYVIHSNLFNIT